MVGSIYFIEITYSDFKQFKRNSIATLKNKSFEKILKEICHKFEC